MQNNKAAQFIVEKSLSLIFLGKAQSGVPVGACTIKLFMAEIFGFP